MPIPRRAVDRNMVAVPATTKVRELVELARRKPSRIFTWVVVPMAEGSYAVTRMNEIAMAAEALEEAVLDKALAEVPGLLRPGRGAQASASLEEARDLALGSPAQRIAVLEDETVLGVLDLGPRRPEPPGLDLWALADGGAPRFEWPYDKLQLSGNMIILEPGDSLHELVTHLETSDEGWTYLVVPSGEAAYQVMPVNRTLNEALGQLSAEWRQHPVGELPGLPRPVPGLEEGTIPWNAAKQMALNAPGGGRLILRAGRPAGVLAARTRRVPQVQDWLEAFEPEMAGAREEPEPAPRFLNAGFFPQNSETLVAVDEPLALDAGPYRLGVNVGEFWGPGTPPGPELAIDGIVRPALADLDEGETLPLVVAVRSRGVPAMVQMDLRPQVLHLPKEGNSPYTFFNLTFRRAGRHAFNVDLFYQGHLLQSRRLEAEVVQRAGLPAPSGRPAQDGYLTFSRAGTLSKESLTILEKRPSKLTITVQREDDSIGLCFYDADGRCLGVEESKLTDAKLNSLLDRTREPLRKACSDYRGRVGGDPGELRLHLWRLAERGAEFYRTLLPRLYDPYAAGPGGEPVDLALNPGQVIQVAPLSEQSGVPWELLYERPIEPYQEAQPDRVNLCDFWAHEPDACPHEDDPQVVCPYGFWGYRYIIEQLPNRVPRGQPPPRSDLPLQVRNSLPLRLVASVYGFGNVDSHLEGLQSLAPRLDLARVDTLDGVEQALYDAEHPADILYFYAHGGFDQDAPTLTLGPSNRKFEFTAGHLAAWRDLDLSPRQPLVVLNACESAAYRPDRVESLLEGFVFKGAAGLIGTQCTVPTTLADSFIQTFFRSFLGQKTVGQALFEARRALLYRTEEGPQGPQRRPDPRGLVYSLFAAADIRLAQPVLD